MLLKQTLMEDMKQAMREGNALKRDTVRTIMSEVKNFEIDNGQQDDAGVQKIVAKLVKQFQDALGDFKTAQREDLISETQTKLDILQAYLPQQMSETELQAIVAEVIAAAPAKVMGPIIGLVMKRVAGQADGGRVSTAVKAALAQN
ncbi:MAG TPA: glutamyl-tRNA amidotransferase [Candidatus Pacebacteria bacterium]|nr:glutamyl-tRNA amidotransferase [Candidatus Paceibacterota bacterium]